MKPTMTARTNKEAIRYYVSPKAHMLLKRAAELEPRSAGNLLDVLILEHVPKIMKRRGENAEEYIKRMNNYDALEDAQSNSEQ